MSRKILVIADDVTAGLEFERALGSVAHEVRFCDQPAAVGSLASS
jgi:hypothetical protein